MTLINLTPFLHGVYNDAINSCQRSAEVRIVSVMQETKAHTGQTPFFLKKRKYDLSRDTLNFLTDVKWETPTKKNL